MTRTAPQTSNIVAKIWSLCHVLRGDGVSYHQYISELTYLLFLKIAKENQSEELLPEGFRWDNLYLYEGDNLLGYYQEMLTHLGASANSKTVKEIYAFPTTVFSHSENLRVVIDGIEKLNWHDIAQDGIGLVYEGLLSKNSEDTRSGAGQYFTPRALVECIVVASKPRLGELIQDPASGTGGFFIAADHYVRTNSDPASYDNNPPKYEGMEIERGTYRLSLMNTFLHSMNAEMFLGDALTKDANVLSQPDLVLANPPFGAKAGSARAGRKDLSFSSSNKQMEFLQHIYNSLKPGGRAAVILPDNTLFEDGVGKSVRQELMAKCNLHTVLRLPTGIFYAPGVKTNVLFFAKCSEDIAATSAVWFYDLRTNMPRFGKRHPLSLAHFAGFINAFGSDPLGQSGDRDKITDPRFRVFSREKIARDGDNLDILWLRDDKLDDPENGAEPEEIVAEIARLLTLAKLQADALQVSLADDIGLG